MIFPDKKDFQKSALYEVPQNTECYPPRLKIPYAVDGLSFQQLADSLLEGIIPLAMVGAGSISIYDRSFPVD